MKTEPAVKRTIAFIDGQNLFHNVRNAFGYNYPNYDVRKLAATVCASCGWKLDRVQFYTGVPAATDNPFWHGFWTNKLSMMGRRGVLVYSRQLVYRNKTIEILGFGPYTFRAVRRRASTCGWPSMHWMRRTATNSMWH